MTPSFPTRRSSDLRRSFKLGDLCLINSSLNPTSLFLRQHPGRDLNPIHDSAIINGFLDLGIGGILDHSRGLRIRKLSFVGSISKECGTLGKFVILPLIGHITEFLGGKSDSIKIEHTNPR